MPTSAPGHPKDWAWALASIGARLSLAGDNAPSALRNALLELGVNAGAVLGLATALVLIRRGAGMRET